MNFFAEAFAFIFDPVNWTGPEGIGMRLVRHALYTLASVGIAAVIAVPLGLLIGHTGRGRAFVIAFTGAARALPTFGFLLFVVLVFGLQLWPVIAVLVILAVPPILAGTYSGVEAADGGAVDGARGSGMSELQIVGRVELPLALPLLVGGIRGAVLQVIAFATIAAYVGQSGLGRYLIEGLALRDITRAIVGAILVAGLALAADGLLAVAQKLVAPRGVSRGAARSTRTRSRDRGAVRTPITEGTAS